MTSPTGRRRDPTMTLTLRVALLALALLPAVAWAKHPKHAKKAAVEPADEMPEFPKEPKPQRAARLWQAGTLAQAKGDYRWAIKQFEACLKAEPADENCKAGLKDSKQKQAWNPPRKKKPKPKTAEQPPAEGAPPADAGSAPAAGVTAKAGDGAADPQAPAPKPAPRKRLRRSRVTEPCPPDSKDCYAMRDSDNNREVVAWRAEAPESAEEYWGNAVVARIHDQKLEDSYQAFKRCVELKPRESWLRKACDVGYQQSSQELGKAP